MFEVHHSYERSLIKIPNVRGAIQRALQQEAELVKKDYEAITATWDHDVTFEIETRYKGGDAAFLIHTDDDIFHYLDEGTEVRYAHMTPDFEPKTVHRWIGSRPGRGGLAFVNTRMPRPGINARSWTQEIKLKHRATFVQRIREAMVSGLTRYYSRTTAR